MKSLKFRYITNLLVIILLIFVVGLFFKQFVPLMQIDIYILRENPNNIFGQYYIVKETDTTDW